MATPRKFQIIERIDYPCADISFSWNAGKESLLRICMHFSRVKGGPDQDLELIFPKPISVQWEDECFGLIDLPSALPKCSSPEFDYWVFPLLIIENSQWATTYADRLLTGPEPFSHQPKHFAFISMNDLLHVLSIDEPQARFIPSVDA